MKKQPINHSDPKGILLFALIIACFMLGFSCMKKNTNPGTSNPNKGSVVFWTKNAANLVLCGNAMNVYILVPTLFGPAVTNTAQIRYTLSAPPTLCVNEAAIENLVAAKYYFAPTNCAIGQFGTLDSFTLLAGECRKIEIP